MSPADEATIPERDGPRDECGVFGIYAPGRDVSRLTYFGLYALQHRGQESAGIAAADRGSFIITQRALGLVSQVFKEHDLRALGGELAIGHVRYSTTGSNEWENSQPVHRTAGNGRRREIALAHNGNLTNAVELHSELKADGVEFTSTSDSEIIAALIAFALLVERFGLLAAAAAAVVLGSLGSREMRPLETIILAVVTAVASVGLFIYLLGQPMVPWNWGL